MSNIDNTTFKEYEKYMDGVVRNSPDYIKEKWLKWYKKGEEIKNHPLILYPIEHNGEVKYVNCNGFKDKILKRIKMFEGTEEDEKEVLRRLAILKSMQQEKGVLLRDLNNELAKSNKNSRLSPLVRFEDDIIKLYGEYNNTKEIWEIVKKDWNIPCRLQEVANIYKTNEEKIKKLREEYISKFNEFNIATDTGRIETLAKLHRYWTNDFDKKPSIEKTNVICKILEQVKKEVKGDVVMNVNGSIDINATIQSNITIDSVLRKLPINMIVVGITAGKVGIHPSNMIDSLVTSYYNKFNGFGQLSVNEKEPSLKEYVKLYNFDDLRKKNKELKEKEKHNVEDAKIISESDINRVEEKRGSLIDLLKGYKSTYKEPTK